MTRLTPLVATGALLLVGCATLGKPAAPQPVCSADELTDYIGKPATAKLGEDIMQASGAKILQWIQPGQMVTMDFRADRLRVRLGPDNKVASANCG
ncbi:I78 family peptidase inhibitor [Sphingomonas sp. KRR8]|uniref:I78 family peptidase inhibitor n=1 Tax=Sphingomonas sp. KRR8 TaxID=2942996 RepID=UPI002022046B|nr:I78 family peptidase inhibitor [Sphingomonas sp. KRR8]URD62125.1 I78 family peptidase inhibitor [Sphingomonas sp. KRR8]